MTEAEMREIDVRQKAKEDEAYFVRTYSERVISLLAEHGISMADLLEKPEAPAGIEVDIEPPVTMPDNAKNTGLRIKTLRESMRMSQEQAGDLPRKWRYGPALSKDAVSKIERAERSTDATALEMALVKEQHQRKNPHEGNPLLVPGDSPTPMRAM